MSTPEQPFNVQTQPAPELGGPSRDDCIFAMLAHVLQIFSYFIGPLIIYLVKRESRFVRFHALQALMWQLIALAAGLLSMAIFMAAMFGTLAAHGGDVPKTGPPPAFVFFFPLIWLVWMGCGAITLILGIIFGIQSHSGKWSRYPLLGNIAWRWSQN